jgi:hypothetical protein
MAEDYARQYHLLLEHSSSRPSCRPFLRSAGLGPKTAVGVGVLTGPRVDSKRACSRQNGCDLLRGVR